MKSARCKLVVQFLILTFAGLERAAALSFDPSTAADNDFQDLVLKDRLFVPYGPDLTTTPPQPSDQVWEGYGFGMGAAEHFAYDPIQGYMYVQSEGGPYVSVIDYSSLPASVTPYSLDLSQFDSDIKDVAVCPQEGLLFVAATDYNRVLMYQAVNRADAKTPELLGEIDAGARPDNIRVNDDCSILAVANENDGDALASGAIHLVSNLQSNGSPTVQKVTFDAFDDDYLLGRDVHMPLSLNAMEYWDDFSELADEIDWSGVRAQYNPGIFMQPEFMVFSTDSSRLYVNLQQNAALVRINVATATAEAVDGYGLKAWTSGNGIDIIKDGGCDLLVTNPILYSHRSPDGIALVEIGDTAFVLTANEGSDADYGAYEEKIEAGDLFNGLVLGPRQFTADASFFSTSDSTVGDSAPFNSACEDNGVLPWCASDLEVSLGSSAVDYSNPSAPVLSKVVTFGGRGISIYKVPNSFDERIELVWDSASDFETKGCDSFPWAHNGVQDEDFAPVDGVRYELNPDEREGLDEMNDPNQDGCDDAGDGSAGACPIAETVDEKAPEDGLAPEAVTVAVACGRLLAISCGENNGDCFLYDISGIASGEDPVLKKVFNLSPASESKSPGVAYKDRTLGDLDAEVTLFVPANESPTGVDAIIFGGAHSGTLSFWEFECATPVAAVESVFVGESGGSNESSGGLNSEAKAAIALGCIVGAAIVGAVGFYAWRRHVRNSETVEIDTNKADDIS